VTLIVIPTPNGGVVGPGLPITIQQEFPLDYPDGAFWQLRLDLQETPGDAVGIFEVPWTHQSSVRILPFTNPTQSVTTNTFTVKPGDTVFLHAYIDDHGIIAESGQGTGTWDPTMGLGAAITETARNTAGGGLTVTQADQLQETWDWVHATLQRLTGEFEAVPISSIVQHPPEDLMSHRFAVFFISGTGYLDGLPDTGLRGIYGLTWGVSTHPPGAGLLQGIVPEWKLRVVQFVPEYTDAATGEFTFGEVLSSHLDQYTWMWQRAFPRRIGYTVAPGFVLRCQWKSF
jgi:hypothetical protein